MSEEKKIADIYDRLRETEAQTREQNIRIEALCKRIDGFSDVVDRFFAVEDKRSERMWKVIAALIGAVVCMAVGPKVTKEIMQTWSGQAQATSYAIPWDSRNAPLAGRETIA